MKNATVSEKKFTENKVSKMPAKKKTTSEMELVDIMKLVPYANNARTHSVEQINKLRSSLREFGFINPVLIDRDYGVIAGHGRIAAAKEESLHEKRQQFIYLNR